jgi:hypothetical protein
MAYGALFAVNVGAGHKVSLIPLKGRILHQFTVDPRLKRNVGHEPLLWKWGIIHSNRHTARLEIQKHSQGHKDDSNQNSKQETTHRGQASNDLNRIASASFPRDIGMTLSLKAANFRDKVEADDGCCNSSRSASKAQTRFQIPNWPPANPVDPARFRFQQGPVPSASGIQTRSRFTHKPPLQVI